MRIAHRDFQGKKSQLKSIEVRGDSLLWTYQSGFCTQNASVPISSLTSVSWRNSELFWNYRIFANNGSGAVDDISETLSAEGQNPSEKEYLYRLYWVLLETVHPHEYSKHRGSEHNASEEGSSEDERKRQKHDEQQASASNANRSTRRERSNNSSSSTSSKQQRSSTQSTASSSSRANAEGIKNALCLIGGNLSIEKRRKLKSTLRMIHHPDHGGNQEFFIALQAALIELDW
jgi:hypothetical protein